MKVFLLFVCGALLAGCTETGNQRADQVGHTVVGQSFARAKDDVCMNNLRQIRLAIEVAKSADPDGTLPATLEEVRGLGPDMKACPIDKVAYEYDPATGTVKCNHPGHKKY